MKDIGITPSEVYLAAVDKAIQAAQVPMHKMADYLRNCMCLTGMGMGYEGEIIVSNTPSDGRLRPYQFNIVRSNEYDEDNSEDDEREDVRSDIKCAVEAAGFGCHEIKYQRLSTFNGSYEFEVMLPAPIWLIDTQWRCSIHPDPWWRRRKFRVPGKRRKRRPSLKDA